MATMGAAEALQGIFDMVKELKGTIQSLETSIKLMEANIKILNNRAAGLMREQQTTIQAEPAQIAPNTYTSQPIRGRQITTGAPQQTIQQMTAETEHSTNVITYKKVFGRLVDANKEAITGALVRVFDKNNEVCATTETDTIGYWESMVKPGRYVAEYTKQGFKAANKTFEVSKTAKEVEVK